MEGTITIDIKTAQKWYSLGGEFRSVALKAFTKDEILRAPNMDEIIAGLPKTWEEFCRSNDTQTMELSDAYTALMRLHKLRDCYRDGWAPSSNPDEYSIVREFGNIKVSRSLVDNRFLSFRYREVAQAFLDNFRDLIDQAGDLI